MCLVSFVKPALACTNFLITPGASVDGSSMISYAADSHVLYGELYHFPAADYPTGATREIVDWDSGRYLGYIPEVAQDFIKNNRKKFYTTKNDLRILLRKSL